MELLAIKALVTKSPQSGVKGPSMLSKIGHFDLVNGFVPDFLHCALLGVARQLVSLWFDSTNHEHPWYVGQPSKQAIYDDRVKNIVAPKEVRRLPRPITAREHWKGNEYKTFVLYYSLIIMQGILPQKYLNHFFLFVWSLHKLLGTCISADDLAKVKAALDLFIVQMEELYGVEHCTFNVHQLSHLARSTQMCGPLWAVSTFIFESNNATLKNMIQGTQYVADQVCQTYTIMKFLPVFMKQNARENDLLIEVLQHLIHGKSETRKAVKLSEELTALSKPKIRNISVEETLSLTDTVRGTVNNVVYEYNRFIFSGKLYETEHYQRSVRRKNCFIKAQRQGKTLYCKISGLLTLKLCNCPIQHHEQCACDKCNVLMCMPFNCVNNRLYKCALLNITSDFISEVSESSDILTLHMHEVISKCIQVTHGGRSYLTDKPNMVEME